VEYAFAVGRGNEITLDDLPPEFREAPAPNSFLAPVSKNIRQGNEADLIREALQAANGHMETAARSIGMSRATFWRKRKKYQIE
jgi:transcriptional regulator of acetoin/glycerol metabolism